MILNIIAPDRGHDSGARAAELRRRVLDRVGYLPEERGLYKKMQVRRLLQFLGELKGMPRKGRRAPHRLLDGPPVASQPEKDWGQAKVDELSRGMQQKVQFIGALLHDPELVILDEPFSGLDPINAQALKDTVVELKREGRRSSSARTSWTTPSGCATRSASSRAARRCSTGRSRRCAPSTAARTSRLSLGGELRQRRRRGAERPTARRAAR